MRAFPRVLRGACIATIGLVSALALAGCAAGGDSNRSAAFQAGYSSGCYNGKIAAGFDEPYADPDPARYGIDHDYTQGWKAGYTECFERFTHYPVMGDKRL